MSASSIHSASTDSASIHSAQPGLVAHVGGRQPHLIDPTSFTGEQRTLDDLGTALCDVTFCVIDFETTGGSPSECAITEVGAVKLRGGECLGTLQTMVNPGQAIPPQITMLTGITEMMVRTAPRIEHVLPTLLEFIGGSVIVGHNVKFDVGFLQAAMERDQRPRLINRQIDTVALARRLVGDEVPNCKLGTLADRLRLDHRPSHRALDDALATGDLLHYLLERASGHGVLGLDDLLSLPKMAGHKQAAKLRLTEQLPRTPGVYQFRDRRGELLYIGKAANLRARVRSYFSSDSRRKIGSLLREADSIEHTECHHQLEAAVLELRLIQRFAPRYNRAGKRRAAPPWVKLTLNEAFPRLSIVRKVADDGCVYLGPFGSHRAAQRSVEAIHTAVPLRRCTTRPGAASAGQRTGPCASAQLGVSTCPCAGGVTAAAYADIVAHAKVAMTIRPDLLLDPLAQKMQSLAGAERFEEAADMRDRAAGLANVLRKRRNVARLMDAGQISVEIEGGGATIVDGRLTTSWGSGAQLQLISPALDYAADHDAPAARFDEAALLSSWLEQHAHKVRLIHAEHGLVRPYPRLDRFAASKRAPRRQN